MAFDFKKECRAPRMEKKGGSPAQNAPPSQINVACV